MPVSNLEGYAFLVDLRFISFNLSIDGRGCGEECRRPHHLLFALSW